MPLLDTEPGDTLSRAEAKAFKVDHVDDEAVQSKLQPNLDVNILALVESVEDCN